MAKKKLKKDYWECSKGCDLSKGVCSHLEAKLPKPGKSVKTYYRSNMDRYFEGYSELTRGHTEEELEALVDKLFESGLNTWQVQLLVCRYVEQMTLAEIKKKYNYTEVNAVEYAIKCALVELRAKWRV